jgi:hypothetical protein
MSHSNENTTKVAEKIQERAHEGAEKAASLAETAASTLRDRGTAAADVSDTVAQKLEGASEYIRSADGAAVKNDVTDFIKKHPREALVAGVVGGFLLSRLLPF